MYPRKLSGVAGMKGPLRVPYSLFDLKEQEGEELDGWAAFLSSWSLSNKSCSHFLFSLKLL